MKKLEERAGWDADGRQSLGAKQAREEGKLIDVEIAEKYKVPEWVVEAFCQNHHDGEYHHVGKGTPGAFWKVLSEHEEYELGRNNAFPVALFVNEKRFVKWLETARRHIGKCQSKEDLLEAMKPKCSPPSNVSWHRRWDIAKTFAEQVGGNAWSYGWSVRVYLSDTEDDSGATKRYYKVNSQGKVSDLIEEYKPNE